MERIEKEKVTKYLRPVTEETAISDLLKLLEIRSRDVSHFSEFGNTFVDYYTLTERLDTKSKRSLSYFDLVERSDHYKNKSYVKKVFDYRSNEKNLYKVWYDVFTLYFGSVSLFKPLTAITVYKKYGSRRVLDPTAGWGGRLVGACALDLDSYVGVDQNQNLREPYTQMVDTLSKYSRTQVNMVFQDAVGVDYSQLDYDTVLTSFPYYNKERYNGQPLRRKKRWVSEFYEPLIKATWEHLKTGGVYCLNVSPQIYEDVCIQVLGVADETIPMQLKSRHRGNYGELVYVWKK